MKIRKFILITLAFLCLLNLNVFSQKTEKYKLKKVVIDAGHGGKDPGAIGKKAQEKEICLAIALKLGYYIETYIEGVEVIYTRKTDDFIELHERANIANDNNADLFISIHVNSTEGNTAYGTSTYVMGLHKSDDQMEVAKTENSVILQEADYKKKYSGFDPDSPETYIILNLYQNAYFDQSVILAEKVQTQFEKRAGRKNGGVRQAGLLVLWQTTMPSVLIETGFISNKKEEDFLITTYGQEIIASAIFRAFRDYKNEVELKNNEYDIVINKENKQKKNIEKEEKVVKKDEDKNNNVKKNEKRSNNIEYKVQIKSSTTKVALDASEFKNIENIEEIIIDGVYKYTVGSTSDFDKILEKQSEIRKKIPGAFVIAFKNGKKVTIKEARAD